MKTPNPMFLGFTAFTLGSLLGFLISSITQNEVQEPVNRVQNLLEWIVVLLILCILLLGVSFYA